MEGTTLTPIEREFIKLTRSADERGIEAILYILICTVSFGADFLEDCEPAIKRGDADEVRATLYKWRKKARAKQ